MILSSKIFKQAIFLVIILFGTFMAVELSFRIGGYQGNQFRSILFGDDINSVLVFEQSPLLWWKLRKNVIVPFLGKKVATDNLGLRVSPHHKKTSVNNAVRILAQVLTPPIIEILNAQGRDWYSALPLPPRLDKKQSRLLSHRDLGSNNYDYQWSKTSRQ